MLWHLERLLLAVASKHWRAMFWLFWSACTAMLLLPGAYVPEIHIWDKLEHASIFLPMVWLGTLGYAQTLRLRVLAVLLQLYGMSIECLQYFVPGRSCSVLDMVADGVGILLAVFTVVCWKQYVSRP